MSILTILLILVVVSLLFGGLGHGTFGYAGWSPLGVLLVILLVLWASGGLGAHGWRIR